MLWVFLKKFDFHYCSLGKSPLVQTRGFFIYGVTMLKFISASIIILSSLILFGCSDATFDKNLRWNNPAKIQCYSNGSLTLDDISTGRVEFSENGAGFYYRSKVTGGLVQVVRSDCFVKEIR